ncbi:MAG: fructose-1,6-bisphosphatase, partial [Planctomycetes bacterium]|nr:fructose-1,6-bisphosphatase [Planctomycetota bacterium]
RMEDLLRPGTELLASGYVLYGPASVLVLATANGVDAFTQDPLSGDFLLTDPGIRIPERGTTYSLNEAHFRKWGSPAQRLATALRGGTFGEMQTARYVGSLVADFHRTLRKGGLFCYPGEAKKPEGKIRLLYEAAPLAWIAEKAGGAASTGKGRILEVVPDGVHDRTPIFIGSAKDVAEAVALLGSGPAGA